MKFYLVSVTYMLNQNIPAPIPSGFVWRGQKQFYMQGDRQPTFDQIKKEALKHGAGTDGFGVIAISEVASDFRNFDNPPGNNPNA